jgi:hypothetical protein
MAKRNQTGDGAIATATKPPVKTGFTLSADAHRRLRTASLVLEKDYSEIIEDLVTTHLTGYYAGRRGSEKAPEAGEDE